MKRVARGIVLRVTLQRRGLWVSREAWREYTELVLDATSSLGWSVEELSRGRDTGGIAGVWSMAGRRIWPVRGEQGRDEMIRENDELGRRGD